MSWRTESFIYIDNDQGHRRQWNAAKLPSGEAPCSPMFMCPSLFHQIPGHGLIGWQRGWVNLRVLGRGKRREPDDDHPGGWVRIDGLPMNTMCSKSAMPVVENPPHTMVTPAFERFVASPGKGFLVATGADVLDHLFREQPLPLPPLNIRSPIRPRSRMPALSPPPAGTPCQAVHHTFSSCLFRNRIASNAIKRGAVIAHGKPRKSRF